MKTLYLISFLFLAAFINAKAEYNFTGKIFNSENEPLLGVTIRLESTQLGSISKADGSFSVNNIKKGQYNLIISSVGYKTKRISISIPEDIKNDFIIELGKQSIDIGEVVVSANKNISAAQEVPLSYAIIKTSDLVHSASTKIDDALRQIPGVTMNNDQVSIRGGAGVAFGAGSRVSFLIDGVPMLSADNSDIKFDILPFTAIERIEVLKGAGSALYGTGALSGVINLITKEPKKQEIYFKAFNGFYTEPKYESWKYSERLYMNNAFDVSYMNDFNGLGVIAAGGISNDEGFKKYGDSHRWNLFAKLNYNLKDNLKASLLASHSEDNRSDWVYWKSLDSATTPPDGTSGDIRVHSKKTSVTAELKYISPAMNSYFVFKSSLFKTFLENTEIKNSLEYRQSDAYNLNNELQANYSLDNNLVFTGGINHQLQKVESFTFGNNSRNIISVYLQGEYKIWDLIVNLGVRNDNEFSDKSETISAFSPKFALTYKPLEDIHIRASVGSGFRSPSIAEKFSSIEYNGFEVIPNLDLKHEKSITAEVGANLGFDIYKMPFYIDMSLFTNHFDDLIEPVFIVLQKPNVQFRNITKARINGMEFSLKTFLSKYLGVSLSALLLDPVDLSDNSILKYRPTQVYTASLLIPINAFELQADFRFIKKYENMDDNLKIQINDHNARVDIKVVDLRFSADFKKLIDIPISLSLHIKNALDYYYTEIPGSLAPTRFMGMTTQLEL